MKERPILMSAPMVIACLNDTKKQTRRIVKPAPSLPLVENPHGMTLRMDGVLLGASKCPYGAPGDRLWVRETWQTGIGADGPQITYKATPDYFQIDAWDGPDEGAGPSFNYDKCPCATWHTNLSDLMCGVEGNWRPGIHMPRWASRLLLEITDVRVERLQDISVEDAIAEGLKAITKDGGRTIKYGIPDRDGYPGDDNTGWPWEYWRISPVDAYHRLWEIINGPGSWDANPWVWVIEFKRISNKGA